MRARFLLLLLWLLGSATLLRADPPTGPLLRPPGNFAQWQVTSVYSDKAPKKGRPSRRAKDASTPPEGRVQKVVTTKTGRVVHEARTDFSQQTTEVWYDGGTQYTQPPGEQSWYRVDSASGDASYRPLPDLGYRDVSLIKTDNYVSTISYEDRQCLVFVPEPAPKIDWAKPAAVQKQLKKLDTVAFVDAETRQPVEIRSNGETRVFQFDPPPTRIQTLPADLLAQIKKGDEARTRLNQPAPRPY